MSKVIWVQLHLKELTSARDRIVRRLELRPVLAPEEMVALLREALVRQGFGEEEGKLVKREGGGVATTVDLATLDVVTEVSREERVDVELQVRREDVEARDEESAERTRQEAQKKARATLESQLADELSRGDTERLRGLNQALDQTYAEALKRKARSLGHVEEVREGTDAQGEYQLLIRVQV